MQEMQLQIKGFHTCIMLELSYYKWWNTFVYVGTWKVSNWRVRYDYVYNITGVLRYV